MLQENDRESQRNHLIDKYNEGIIAKNTIVPILIKLTIVIIAIIYGISNSKKSADDLMIALLAILVLYFITSLITWIFRFLDRFFWGLISKLFVSIIVAGAMFGCYQVLQGKIVASLSGNIATIVDFSSIILLGIPLIIDICILIRFIKMKITK